jgi:hypothetical protein
MKITHALTSRRGSRAPQTQQASNQVKDGVVWVYSYTWKGQVHNTYYYQLTYNSLIFQSHGLVRTF